MASSNLDSLKIWAGLTGRTVAYGSISVGLGPLTRDHRASRWAMHRWCRSVCILADILPRVHHAERIERAPQAVIIANHLSHADIIVIGSTLTCDYRWLAKDALFNIPFLGWHLRLAGHVPVFRGEKKKRNASLGDRVHKVVEEGGSLLFFPEGTRSQDGKLQRFRRGAFQVAVDEGLPIFPLVVRGTHEVLQKGSSLIRPADTSVTALPLVHPPAEGSVEERVQALRETCYQLYLDALGEQPDAPTVAPNAAPVESSTG